VDRLDGQGSKTGVGRGAYLGKKVLTAPRADSRKMKGEKNKKKVKEGKPECF